MDRIYLARHPAPLIGIARRGSAAQAFHEAIVTPVTLAEMDADEFVPAGRLNDLCKGLGAPVELDLRRRRGGTWVALPGGEGLPPRDALTAFVEGQDLGWRTNATLHTIFAGTPLVASLRNEVTTLTRGADVASSLRGIEEFEPDKARAALAEFMAERVAIAGSKACARLRPRGAPPTLRDLRGRRLRQGP